MIEQTIRRVEVKRIRVTPELSQGSTYFSAAIFVNGRMAGTAENRGDGSATAVHMEDQAMSQMLAAWCAAQPDHVICGVPVTMLPGLWVDLQVEAHALRVAHRQLCATATLFRLHGDPVEEWRVLDQPFSAELRADVLADFGADKVAEFLNDRLEAVK